MAGIVGVVLTGTVTLIPGLAHAGVIPTTSYPRTTPVTLKTEVPVPIADVLDVDLRDGTATDHAQGLAPTVIGEPVFGADASRARSTVSFNGVKDAIKYPFDAQFAKMQGGFALECTFRYDAPSNPSSEKAVCSAKEGGGFATVTNSSGITFMAHIGGGYKSISAPLTPGRWYHTAATWDGAQLRLYVDGELVGTTAAAGTFKAPTGGANSLVLGGDTQPGDGVSFLAQATLQNARVWSQALDAAQVSALAEQATVVPDAPRSDLFEVDFTDGTPAERVSDLAPQTWNTPQIIDYAPLGRKVGKFDGTSAYYYAFSNEQYDRIRGAMTLECVFKYDEEYPGSGETRGNLCGGKEAGGFSMTLYGSELSFNPHIGGSYRNTKVKLTESDRWYHAVGTYDGSKVRLYVNGKLAAESNATGNVSNPSPVGAQMFVIGGDAANGKPQFFAPAHIASARIFTQAVDLQDVLALQYQAFGSRDAEDLVRVTSSTPAADSQLTRATRYRVEMANAEALSRDVVHALDDRPIEPGEVIGAGLASGRHTITIDGHDVFGNVIAEQIAFTSANIPSGGGTETEQGGGRVTLAAVATNPSGGDVTTTFRAGKVVTADSTIQGTLDKLPTTLEFSGHAEETVTDGLAPRDDALVHSPSAEGISYQRFDIPAAAGAGDQQVSWSGTVDPTREVRLRFWNGTKWVVLGAARGSATGTVTLSGLVDASSIVEGRVPVLVTGEDPFADDFDKPVADGFEHPDDYDFTIAHLTDTQYLSEGAVEQETPEERAKWKEAYTSITQWIADNASDRKIAFAAHTGDIIENLHSSTNFSQAYIDNAREEFKVASDAQQILDAAGVVNSVLPGNHDNRYGTETGPEAMYNDYFGPDRYQTLSSVPDTDWATYDASYHPWRPGDNSNSFNLFTASGLDFVAVNLGFGVDAEEIAWANSVLEQYQDRNAIVQTHAHTTPSTNPDGRGGALSYDGNAVRNQVAAKNPNVFLVLSGHEHGVNIEVVRNLGQEGNNVVELLADYQFYTVPTDDLGLTQIGGYNPGTRLQFGSSFFRLLQIDVDRAEMSVDTYSALLDNFGATEYDDGQRYNGQEDDFKLPVQLETRTTSFATDSVTVVEPTDEVIGTDTARSGWPAEVVWEGLSAGETYAWYATSADAASGEELPGEVDQMSVFTAQPAGTDTTAPVVTFEETTTVQYGAEFDVLAGVTAADDTDGDLTSAVAVTGTVDTDRIGTYTLLYTVADANGNQAVASRTVEVVAPPAPVNTTRPEITGTGKVGHILHASMGEWEHTDEAGMRIQWFRNGSPIEGATGVEHAVTAADRGTTLTAVVTAKVIGNDPVVARSEGFSVSKAAGSKTAEPKGQASQDKRKTR